MSEIQIVVFKVPLSLNETLLQSGFGLDHLTCFLSPALFQDVYPKGVIPLAAIQMARPAKDNKFEIVTSHRIFVFRTDNEGKKRKHTPTGEAQVHFRSNEDPLTPL